jgi:hypothetical protein
VFRNTIAGLFGCQASQCDRRVGSSLGHRRADPVHFGLSGVQKFALRFTSLGRQRAGFLDGKKIVVKFGHNFSTSVVE